MILSSGNANANNVSMDIELIYIMVSLIPYIYHAKVIKAACKHKKNVVTTSYVSPAMMEYDQA